MNANDLLSDLRERIDRRTARGAAVIVLAGAIGLAAGAVPSHAMGGRDEGSTVAHLAIRAPALGAPAPAPAAPNAAGSAGSSAAPSGVRGLFDRLLGRDPGTGDCALVGVRADEAGTSHLFWFDVATGRTMSLTADLPNADVRAVEVSPVSGAVYVVTGGRGRYPGRLYVLDEASGRLSVVGELSGARADAVGDATFRPDGSLWAFRRNVGLVTIDLATGWSRVVWTVTGDGIGLAWDGVAWDPAGEYLYGAQGGDLYRWDPRTRSASVLCRSGLLPADVAGLDFRTDGTLVAGRRSAATGNLTFVAVDLESCTVAAADHDVAAPGVTSFSYAACGKPASLSATVWRDENANGAIDLGEPPLAGVKVALRLGTCGAPGEVVARASTATDGGYTFDDVAPGPYCVEVESDSGQLAPVVTTGAAGHTVVVPAGQGAEASPAGEAPGFGLLDEVAYKRIAAVAPGAAEESSAMPGPGAAAPPRGAPVAGPGAGLDDFSGTGPAEADSVGPDSEVPISGEGGCNLYPIALSSEMMKDATKGSRLGDIWNGTQPGNFGWLTWTGKLSTGVLATSLTPPGDSYTYINPQNPDDHTVSVGDWVKARPGVSNRSRIRDALDILKTIDIVVPVWDQSSGRGSKARYRISDYAAVRLESYRLPGTNRITAKYVGEAECDAEHEEEEPEVEFCPYDLDVPVGATFNIRDYVHRKHDEDDDEDKPIDWSRIAFTYRDDAGEAGLMDWHLDDFNAGRDV
ncbi:MAG: SdrD B-like domain-containing protein, partial [Anaerolineae bacterium]